MSIEKLYQDTILEHNQEPSNFGGLKDADVESEGFNPMCGDRIILRLKLDSSKSRLVKQAFEGEACSICLASASMMTECIEGESLSDIESQVARFRSAMQGGPWDEALGEDLQSLSGVARFPVRIKCALLPWTTLNDAISKLTPSDEEN